MTILFVALRIHFCRPRRREAWAPWGIRRRLHRSGSAPMFFQRHDMGGPLRPSMATSRMKSSVRFSAVGYVATVLTPPVIPRRLGLSGVKCVEGTQKFGRGVASKASSALTVASWSSPPMHFGGTLWLCLTCCGPHGDLLATVGHQTHVFMSALLRVSPVVGLDAQRLLAHSVRGARSVEPYGFESAYSWDWRRNGGSLPPGKGPRPLTKA